MVAAAVLSIARHAPFATDPFDYTGEGIVATTFAGPIQKSYLRAGFGRLAGAPMATLLPTDPPSGTLYVNHPPLLHWATWPFIAAFGLKEWSLRALPILLSAFTAALLARVAALHLGRLGALASAAIFATLPIEFFFGRMSNYEPPVLLVGLLAQSCLPSQGDSRIRRSLACALVFLATSIDWEGAFLVPGFLLHEWIARRRPPPARLAVLLLLSAILSVLAMLALMRAWTGSAREWSAILENLARKPTGVEVGLTVGSWLSAQGEYLVSLAGWPGLIAMCLGVAGAVAGIVRCDSILLATFAAWGTVAVLNVVAFPQHSFVHEHWWFYLIPVAVLAPAALVCELARRKWRLAALAVLAAVLAGGIVDTARRYASVERTAIAHLTGRVAALGSEDTLLLCLAGDVPWVGMLSFYFRPWLVPTSGGVQELEDYVRRFRSGELKFRKLAVLASEQERRLLVPLSAEERERLRSLGFVERPQELAPGLVLLEITR
jgi:4-amino-4-deoxy-L-arabinose transferase-like glycosyltransferase